MKSFFETFFNEHRIRANFYHIVATAFLITTVFWSFDVIDDTSSFIIGIILFTTDWLAEMYDPHPDNAGPWFKTHFHRITDETSANVIKWVLGIFIVLIIISISIPVKVHDCKKGHHYENDLCRLSDVVTVIGGTGIKTYLDPLTPRPMNGG